MPMIKIQYDNEKVTEENIKLLSVAIQNIVSDITKIEDVFVYTNSSHIKVKVAPVEIFVEMSECKIKDLDLLTAAVAARLSKWKLENAFSTSLNLSIIPMQWKVQVGI